MIYVRILRGIIAVLLDGNADFLISFDAIDELGWSMDFPSVWPVSRTSSKLCTSSFRCICSVSSTMFSDSFSGCMSAATCPSSVSLCDDAEGNLLERAVMSIPNKLMPSRRWYEHSLPNCRIFQKTFIVDRFGLTGYTAAQCSWWLLTRIMP